MSMANSLRAKLSKLRHDGHITDAEYQAFIKKLDGHDVEIRNKAIYDFAQALKKEISFKYGSGQINHAYKAKEKTLNLIDEIAEQLKAGDENA